MMKGEKEMIYFEEVDRIKVFRGVNKQLVLGRGINRNIMECKCAATRYNNARGN